MKHKKKPHFPREDYAPLELYRTERDPVEVDLSDNTNLWGAHPGALAAVQAAVAKNLTRYPDFYVDDLREAAAERFGVGPGNVCTGCGSDHILDSAFRAAAASGGLISYAAPSFIMVEYFARLNGRTTRPTPWADAIADPSRLLAGDPVLVYVCRPNNPTGLLAPGDWLRGLLDAAGPDGPLVLVDEAYAEFAPPGESFVQEAAARPRLLVARTLSKAFGLAGLRVGVGVGSPEVAREMEKSRGPYMVSSLAEAAAVRVLRDEEKWVERTVAECLKNRERLVSELRTRGLSPLPTAANFVMIPVREGCALRYARELRAKGVAIRPFPAMHGAPEGIRVTVAPWNYMERFLGGLDEILEADAACEADVVVQVDAGAQAAKA
jgi:histidinol-phosphate aminotransferase